MGKLVFHIFNMRSLGGLVAIPTTSFPHTPNGLGTRQQLAFS